MYICVTEAGSFLNTIKMFSVTHHNGDSRYEDSQKVYPTLEKATAVANRLSSMLRATCTYVGSISVDEVEQIEESWFSPVDYDVYHIAEWRNPIYA